jgi:RNA polymerase nonessential primary-like sigma factor
MAKTLDLVGSHLKQIARYPLLTASDEISLGRQVQEMMEIKNQQQTLELELGQEASIFELSQVIGKTEAEIKTILEQGKIAKHQMVICNLRLVVNVAKKYQDRNVDFMDLIQEGTLGLDRGVEKFDPTKGFKLSTYVYWWITQSITRAIAEKSRTIRLPVHLNEALNKIKRKERELAQRLGRTPTVAEIAECMDITPDKVRQYLAVSRAPLSLEAKVGEDKETELGELLPTDAISSEEILNQELMSNDVRTFLECLSEVQRQVIIWKFGLEGDELTLSEIGQRLNLCKERVRQIQYKAIYILRHQKSNLRQYLLN